ncbi:TPA: hypothetical protein DCW61_05380, partial [Candidatus Uhrbacteria bacterium]|nr:hypothetical protein [Candidatus Uhrbacteria bacterium]
MNTLRGWVERKLARKSCRDPRLPAGRRLRRKLGGSRFQEEQGLNGQGSENLPRGGDPHAAVTAAIAPAVDEEATPDEEPDVDVITARVNAGGADVVRRQEADVPDRLVR